MVNIISIFSLTISSSFLTRWLVNSKKISAIRASSFITLVAAGFSWSFDSKVQVLVHSAVLGATFVGMTEPSKLSKRGLVLANLLFSFAYLYLLPLNQGLGGALGFLALTSCLISYLIFKCFLNQIL